MLLCYNYIAVQKLKEDNLKLYHYYYHIIETQCTSYSIYLYWSQIMSTKSINLFLSNNEFAKQDTESIHFSLYVMFVIGKYTNHVKIQLTKNNLIYWFEILSRDSSFCHLLSKTKTNLKRWVVFGLFTYNKG